jgi:hypothetical protein
MLTVDACMSAGKGKETKESPSLGSSEKIEIKKILKYSKPSL